MKVIRQLNEVSSACGNVLRGSVEIGGEEFRLEANLTKTHLQVINEKSDCETFTVAYDGITAEGGEFITGEWTDADWQELTSYIGAK